MIRALLLLLALAALARGEELRVGLDTRTPPWSFVPGVDYSNDDLTQDPTPSEAQLKTAQGIDVDVAKALARRLGMSLRIVPVAWFNEEQGLLEGRYDAIVGAWTPNPKTPASIAASSPYYSWGLQIAVRADNTQVMGYADLKGARVGHYRDAVAERTVRSLGASALVSFDSQEAMFEELKAGALAAVLFDSPYVLWRIARDKELRAVGAPLNRLGYHVGVRKADAALVDRVETAIKAMATSGELAQIERKWGGTTGR
jgi:polar amino acid transport system substrate-binding protein